MSEEIIELKKTSYHLKNLYLDPNNYRFVDNKNYKQTHNKRRNSRIPMQLLQEFLINTIKQNSQHRSNQKSSQKRLHNCIKHIQNTQDSKNQEITRKPTYCHRTLSFYRSVTSYFFWLFLSTFITRKRLRQRVNILRRNFFYHFFHRNWEKDYLL